MPRPHPAITEATAGTSSVSFDDVEQCLPGFHFGRFDVIFERLAELQPGRDVAIAGVNGAGAEQTLS